MEHFRNYLGHLTPGEVKETAELERLLAECWSDLQGDDGGMEGYKLRNRMEKVVWNPPQLAFLIERHGGTVMGSSRAEMQHWVVDVDQKMATLEKGGYRQIRPMARRISIAPIVEEIATMIINHQRDDRLNWEGDDRVQVVTGRIFPKGSAVKMTLEYRRKRFRAALRERLEQEGWDEAGRNIYVRKKGGQEA
jgi:hypothetical protein